MQEALNSFKRKKGIVGWSVGNVTPLHENAPNGHEVAFPAHETSQCQPSIYGASRIRTTWLGGFATPGCGLWVFALNLARLIVPRFVNDSRPRFETAPMISPSPDFAPVNSRHTPDV